MYPNPSSRPGLACWSRLAMGLLLTALPAGAKVEFAEELFPELGRLMELAASQAPGLQVQQLRVEERSGELQVARGQRLPQVRLSARALGVYETRDDIGDQTRGSVNGSLTVSQPLYQWGNLARRQSIAERRESLQRVEAELGGASHFMDIRWHYLQWLLEQQRQEILQQSIGLSQTFVDARRQLVDAGLSAEQDLLEMEARLLENRELLAWSEKRLLELEARLAQLVGLGFDPDLLVAQPLSRIQPMDTATLDILEARVLGRQGDFPGPWNERFDYLKDIEASNLAILDKTLLPQLELVGGIFTDRLDAVNANDSVMRTEYYLGLQVSWNIFDGRQTGGWKRSTLARIRSLEVQAEHERDVNRSRAETLIAELRLNLRQIEARETREKMLSRRMELLQSQVDRAQISGTELLEGEIHYLETRRGSLEARVAYLINLMELSVLLGEDPASIYYASES